jgi:hypothetical protein
VDIAVVGLLELGFQEREQKTDLGKAFYRFRRRHGVHEQVEGSRRARTNFHSCRRWFTRACEKRDISSARVARLEGHNGKVGFSYDVYSIGEVEELRIEVDKLRFPEIKAGKEQEVLRAIVSSRALATERTND